MNTLEDILQRGNVAGSFINWVIDKEVDEVYRTIDRSDWFMMLCNLQIEKQGWPNYKTFVVTCCAVIEAGIDDLGYADDLTNHILSVIRKSIFDSELRLTLPALKVKLEVQTSRSTCESRSWCLSALAAVVKAAHLPYVNSNDAGWCMQALVRAYEWKAGNVSSMPESVRTALAKKAHKDNMALIRTIIPCPPPLPQNNER